MFLFVENDFCIILSKHVVLVGALSKESTDQTERQGCRYSKLHSNLRPCGTVTVCEDLTQK